MVHRPWRGRHHCDSVAEAIDQPLQLLIANLMLIRELGDIQRRLQHASA